MVSDLPVFQQNCHIRYGLNPKKGRICVAWVWNREGTEKLVNGKQHSVWFVPTGMKGLPQNVLLNFRLEFPKSDLTIYLPSGISEIFCRMVSTPVLLPFLFGWGKERLTHLLYRIWTFVWLVEKQKILRSPAPIGQATYLRLFITETTRWSSNSFNSKFRF